MTFCVNSMSGMGYVSYAICFLVENRQLGSLSNDDAGADPGISERGGGGLFTIVVTFNASGVEGE